MASDGCYEVPEVRDEDVRLLVQERQALMPKTISECYKKTPKEFSSKEQCAAVGYKMGVPTKPGGPAAKSKKK